MFLFPDHHDQTPRVLVIHDDPDLVQPMLTALGRACCDALPLTPLERRGGKLDCRCAEQTSKLPNGEAVDAHHPSTLSGKLRTENVQSKTELSNRNGEHGIPCVTVLTTLRQLHNHDLSTCDIVICASTLPDGSGLDALAYVRGIRPDLPVMIGGDPSDTPLAVEAIRAGAVDFLVTSGSDLRMLPLTIEKCLAHQRIKQENDHLQDDLSRSLSETAIKNRQLQTLIHQLETMARTDDLTGLCNRRWLNMMLERSWAESLRHGHPLAFMMIDLDGFKIVNDLFGHQEGDELLRITGRALDANCRQIDLPARYGGDEFCILLPNTHLNEAAVVTHRVQQACLAALKEFLRNRIDIGMSIGLAHITASEPVSSEQLITHADEALYTAKSAGKNRVMVRDKSGMTPLEQLVVHSSPCNSESPEP